MRTSRFQATSPLGTREAAVVAAFSASSGECQRGPAEPTERSGAASSVTIPSAVLVYGGDEGRGLLMNFGLDSATPSAVILLHCGMKPCGDEGGPRPIPTADTRRHGTSVPGTWVPGTGVHAASARDASSADTTPLRYTASAGGTMEVRGRRSHPTPSWDDRWTTRFSSRTHIRPSRRSPRPTDSAGRKTVTALSERA